MCTKNSIYSLSDCPLLFARPLKCWRPTWIWNSVKLSQLQTCLPTKCSIEVHLYYPVRALLHFDDSSQSVLITCCVCVYVCVNLEDQHLVSLQDPVGYINASRLDTAAIRYIITQSPQQNSVCKFWQMVWEQDMPLIVMLNNEQSKVNWSAICISQLQHQSYTKTVLLTFITLFELLICEIKNL